MSSAWASAVLRLRYLVIVFWVAAAAAATVLLRALKTSAVSSYGCQLDTKNVA